MARDHLSQSEWDAYRQRTLSPEALLAVSDHLTACPECAARRSESAPVPVIPEFAQEDPIGASYEEIVAWVDGTMTDPVDREIFEARMAQDPALRAEVTDLSAFRAAMGRLPPHAHEPEAAPSNLVQFPARSVSRWLLPLAAAAAVLATMLIWNAVQSPNAAPTGLAARTDALARAVDAALVTGKLDVPPLAPELRAERGVLAGDAPEAPALEVVQPVGRIVRERRPQLSWRTKARADGFTVQIQRLSDGSLISSPVLPANARQWQPQEPLEAGGIYEWQVQAMHQGVAVDQAPRPPEPEARFQVLNAGAEAGLRAAENAPGRSELLLGMAYARAGMAPEADAHWQSAGSDGARLRKALKSAGAQP